VNRTDLFQPGRYVALPDVLLRRPDLRPAAKCVWAALASHLGPDGTEVWPSINRLARLTGLHRDTIIIAIASLERAQLLIVDRTPGRSSHYRILQPQAGLFAAADGSADRSEKPTGRKNRPVGNPDDTGRKNRPPPVGNPDPPIKDCSEVLQELLPPNPPEGASSGHSLDETTARIATAFQVAFRHGPTASWTRAITREYNHGDRARLAAIDADVLRATKARCRQAHPPRRLNLARVLETIAETTEAAAAALATGSREAQRAAEAAAATEASAADRARRLETYRALPPEVREHYRTKAREMRFSQKPELVETLAAFMAANDNALQGAPA